MQFLYAPIYRLAMINECLQNMEQILLLNLKPVNVFEIRASESHASPFGSHLLEIPLRVLSLEKKVSEYDGRIVFSQQGEVCCWYTVKLQS